MAVRHGLQRSQRSPDPARRAGPPRVVVGIGESPSSTEALRWAHELCSSRGWRLDIVAAWPDVGEVWVHEVPGHYCEPRGRAVAAAQAAMTGAGVEIDDPAVRVHIENAEPVRALLVHSRGAKVLVLGASGPGRSRKAGRAPVGDVCREQARCPVIVVNADGTILPLTVAS